MIVIRETEIWAWAHEYFKQEQRRIYLGMVTFSGGRIHERVRIMIVFLCTIPSRWTLIYPCTGTQLSHRRRQVVGKSSKRQGYWSFFFIQNTMIGQRSPIVAQSPYRRPIVAHTLLYISYHINNCSQLDSNLHQPAIYLLGDHHLTIQAIGTDT